MILNSCNINVKIDPNKSEDKEKTKYYKIKKAIEYSQGKRSECYLKNGKKHGISRFTTNSILDSAQCFENDVYKYSFINKNELDLLKNNQINIFDYMKINLPSVWENEYDSENDIYLSKHKIDYKGYFSHSVFVHDSLIDTNYFLNPDSLINEYKNFVNSKNINMNSFSSEWLNPKLLKMEYFSSINKTNIYNTDYLFFDIAHKRIYYLFFSSHRELKYIYQYIFNEIIYSLKYQNEIVINTP